VKVWVEMSFSAGIDARSRRSRIEMLRGRSTFVLVLMERLGIEMNIGGGKFRDEGEVVPRPRCLRRKSRPDGSASTVIFSMS